MSMAQHSPQSPIRSPLFAISITTLSVELIESSYVFLEAKNNFASIPWMTVSAFLSTGLTLVSLLILLSGHLRLAGSLLSASLMLAILVALVPFGIRQGSTVMVAITIPLTIAGLYTNRTFLGVLIAVTTSGLCLIYCAEQFGFYVPARPKTPLSIDFLTVLLVIAIFSWVLLTYLGELMASRRITDEYQAKLETEVRERTQELRIALHAAEVARLRAEQADAAKMVFIANTSHELRTPLHAINGMGKYIRKDGPLTVQQSRHLDRVLFNTSHLLSLINEVLDISKIESGQMVLSMKPVNLRLVLDDLLGDMRPLAQQKEIELRSSLPPEPIVVLGDISRLRQVLLNLLSNAVKFTDTGTVSLVVSPEESFWAFRVIDTGIGIPPEDHEIIFQPFRQVQHSLARDHGGTGLGLPISKFFAEQHGGRIVVESAPGKGSTFTLFLPRHGMHAAANAGGAPTLKVAQTFAERAIPARTPEDRAGEGSASERG